MNENKENGESIEKKNEQKDKDKQNENTNPKIKLSRMTRLLIFLCFYFIQLFNCSDGGVVSADSNKIKQELKIGDNSFGFFGSIVQIGRIIGTFSVMFFLDYFNRKYLIFSAILLKSTSFLIFVFSTKFHIVMLFRFLQGFSHVFTYVYFPTWVDQFGFQEYKTIMTSIIVTASPFGSVLGFNISTFLNSYKYGFAVLAFSMLTLDFFLLFIPNKYFSRRIFFYQKITEEINGRETVYSLFEIHREMVTKKLKNIKSNPGLVIWLQLLRPIFSTIVLARCILIYSFMGLHYWIGDYFENVLGEEGKFAKTSVYSIVSLIGPTSGSIVGGAICEYFGGYTKKTSSFICIIFSLLTALTASFIPITTSLSLFAILLFLFFFFGNCMMPILVGISFNSVDNEAKGASYGVNSLICTFFGNLPSPLIYGLINSKYKNSHKSLAMAFNCYYVWVNTILIMVNGYLRFKEKKEEENIKQIQFELKDMNINSDDEEGDEVIQKY